MGIVWLEFFRNMLLRLWKNNHHDNCLEINSAVRYPRKRTRSYSSSKGETENESELSCFEKNETYKHCFKSSSKSWLPNKDKPQCSPQSSLQKVKNINGVKSELIGKLPKGCTMELDLLEKKIRRLVSKLKKFNVDLEVFDPEDIVIQKQILGRGGEAVVQKCMIFYNGLPVDAAVKTLICDNVDSINITLDEIELLCLAKDHIIQTTQKIYGVAAVPDCTNSNIGQLVILTEAGLMNALQLYQDYEIPLYVTYELWSNISAAIHIMHCKKIIHQDIKPENVLVTAIVRDTMGQVTHLDVKIIDLGMSRRVFTDKILTDDILGTNGYHPPEIIMEESYDFRADVFMLGLTFCVLIMPNDTLRLKLSELLKNLHDAKRKGFAGKNLFINYLQKHLNQSLKISPIIKNMLCLMIEKQDKRNISLIEVVEICREEWTRCKEMHENDRSTSSSMTDHIKQKNIGLCHNKDQVLVSNSLPKTPDQIEVNTQISRSTRHCNYPFKKSCCPTLSKAKANGGKRSLSALNNSPSKEKPEKYLKITRKLQ